MSLGDALYKVAEKLGIAVQGINKVYVQQAYLYGIAYLLFSLLTLGVTILFFVISLKNREPDPYGDRFAFLIFLIFGIIGSFVFLALLIIGIFHFVNPQYFAIQDLLSSFSGSNM